MSEPGWGRRAARDRLGNSIYITEERWKHIVLQRPWLDGHLDDVLDALRLGKRKQDPLNQDKYKYYLPCDDLLPEHNHIVAVVLFRNKATAGGKQAPNNFVVTVWTVYIYPKR